MISYSRYFVKIVEYWYDEPCQPGKDIDVVRIMQRSNPLNGRAFKEFYTIWIDLKQDSAAIFDAMEKSNRKIIRNEFKEDGIVYENCLVTDDLIEQFVSGFNVFAACKGIPRLSGWKLKAYARNGKLEITRAKVLDGTVLSWVSYYKDETYARGLQSYSHFRQYSDSAYRNFVGKVNRYLDWHNIMRYKDQGLSVFDFGGWYPGESDKAKLDINKFKEGFGGKIVKTYNHEFGITLKGKLFVFVLHTRDFLKALMTNFINYFKKIFLSSSHLKSSNTPS